MDFTTDETTGDLTGLARDIASKISTPERVAELEAQAAPLDAALWQELGAAGLIGLELPDYDSPHSARPDLAGVGGGRSTVDTVAVATEVGRALGVVPYASTAIGVLPTLAGWTANSRDEWLARVATGEAVIAAAVDEDTVYDPYAPAATTLTDGVLRGTKVNVAFAAASDALLVTAEGDSGPVVVLVETTSEGVSVTPAPSTGLLPTAQVDFSDVAIGAEAVVASGTDAVAALVDRLNLAACAEQCGILEEALRRTASYAAEREQFDRKIGSFQAVAQRLADGYIDVQGLILTTTQAAWLLSEGLDAAAAIDTAKFWVGQAGHRVSHTAIHVHGGVGLDTSHPTHRYFLRAKQNEYALAGEPAVLARLGDRLAAEPA